MARFRSSVYIYSIIMYVGGGSRVNSRYEQAESVIDTTGKFVFARLGRADNGLCF